MGNHKDLEAWKLSVNLVSKIYVLTKDFPKGELYCLTSQIRRCAISIPSNIAEGSARQSDKELIQFLYIALGSLAELETQLIISQMLSYISNIQEVLEDLNTIKKTILGLLKYLKNKKPSHLSPLTAHQKRK